MTKSEENKKIVLDILQDEIKGDVQSALNKMHEKYSMTWVYKSKTELFPTTSKNLKDELEEVYKIENREYKIKHILADDDTVMVEMIESYTDPNDGKTYRTPEVIVLEIKDGKIITGRHYCDPQISHLNLSESEIGKIYK